MKRTLFSYAILVVALAGVLPWTAAARDASEGAEPAEGDVCFGEETDYWYDADTGEYHEYAFSDEQTSDAAMEDAADTEPAADTVTPDQWYDDRTDCEYGCEYGYDATSEGVEETYEAQHYYEPEPYYEAEQYYEGKYWDTDSDEANETDQPGCCDEESADDGEYVEQTYDARPYGDYDDGRCDPYGDAEEAIDDQDAPDEYGPCDEPCYDEPYGYDDTADEVWDCEEKAGCDEEEGSGVSEEASDGYVDGECEEYRYWDGENEYESYGWVEDDESYFEEESFEDETASEESLTDESIDEAADSVAEDQPAEDAWRYDGYEELWNDFDEESEQSESTADSSESDAYGEQSDAYGEYGESWDEDVVEDEPVSEDASELEEQGGWEYEDEFEYWEDMESEETGPVMTEPEDSDASVVSRETILSVARALDHAGSLLHAMARHLTEMATPELAGKPAAADESAQR